MNNVIINPKDEENRQAATKQPHGFIYVDRLQQEKTDGYNVQVTLGWENPSGGTSPVVTAAMPAPFAKELAQALLDSTAESLGKRGKTA